MSVYGPKLPKERETRGYCVALTNGEHEHLPPGTSQQSDGRFLKFFAATDGSHLLTVNIDAIISIRPLTEENEKA